MFRRYGEAYRQEIDHRRGDGTSDRSPSVSRRDAGLKMLCIWNPFQYLFSVVFLHQRRGPRTEDTEIGGLGTQKMAFAAALWARTGMGAVYQSPKNPP